MPRENLLSYLSDFSRHSRRTCFLFDDGFRTRRYSYRQVLHFAEGFASRLQLAGIGARDKVIFWCENRPEWVVAFWGCLKLNSIAVPVDCHSSPEFVSRIHQIVSAKLLLIGDETSPLELGIPVWKLRFDQGIWHSDKPPVANSPSADSIAEIVFTSGATGTPKGVVIRHKNLLANLIPMEREIEKYRRYVGLVSPLRFLNLLPLSHMFGQIASTFIPQILGGVVAFQKGYNPRDLLSFIRHQHISVLICVPKLLDVFKEYVMGEFPETAQALKDNPSSVFHRWWKYRRLHARFGLKFWSFAVGGAPLPPEVEAFWSRLGFLILQGYGLTETAPMVSVNHPFGARRGSLGKPIAGLEVKLAEDGEILIRGGNVTSGYYNSPEETAQAFQDGWFRTGDIGEMDAEGHLFYRGRKKEMIVTAEGLNVFPDDVEKVLNNIEGVKESAVIGLSVGGEEKVHASLILDRDRSLAEVQRAANRQLEDHQRLHSISVWQGTEFPRTESTQKLKRNEIRAELQGEIKARSGPGADSIEQLLGELVGRDLGQLQGQTKLSEDLGLSSLERVELLVALENRFNVSVDDQLFAQAREVNDLKQLVTRTQGAEPTLKFSRWSSTLWAAAIRAVATITLIVPLTRLFVRLQLQGREHLSRLRTPVLLAANHVSHLDVPVIKCALPWRLRFGLAPAMSMEFFRAHFWPETFPWHKRLRSHLEYYSACLFLHGFPLPQRQLGARPTLRFMGQLVERGHSLLTFPEGARSPDGEIAPFQPGVALMAAFLKIPVVPLRIEGLERVLPVGARWPRAGKVRVAFGSPTWFEGSDYARFARELEVQVRKL